MKLNSFIPAMDWLPGYGKSELKGDLFAGLTVGVMLIPQGMAYAMIAGLPPIYGLYASTIPLIIYALLGTSRQLAVGPVAMVSLLTASSVGLLADGGTETYILLAISLALMVGLIQFFLGAFKLGFLVSFLSHPVISGFTSAAALIIGLSQLKHLLGFEIPRSHHVHEIITHAIQDISSLHWITFAIGIGGIFLILGLKKVHKSIPGPLVAVIFGVGLVALLGLDSSGVKIVGDVPGGLPSFSIPKINTGIFSDLLPAALAIALVSFMESIAVAKAIQAKHKSYKVDPNKELVALGLSNVGGSFLQSYPVTGGFSRTAVNDQAGARTGMSSIISAVLIILTLLFLTPLFYYLPNAILASVIMVAVFGLIDFKEAKHLWHSNRSDFYMLLVTFITTLAFGIEQGIAAGVILSLAVVIFRSSRPHTAVLGRVPETNYYRNVDRFKDLREREDILILRFDAPLYFANIEYFRNIFEDEIREKGDELKAIILPSNSIYEMDSSAASVISDLIDQLEAQNIRLMFSAVRGPVRDAMDKYGLIDKIGEENFFMNIQEAVDHVNPQKQSDRSGHAGYAVQVNE